VTPRLVPPCRRIHHARLVPNPPPVLDSTSRLCRPPGTEDFHPCRAVRQVATQFLVDVKVPRRVGVEAREHGLLVATVFSGLSEDDLRVTVLAEHSLEGNVSEYVLPADGTPEELEQYLTVSVEHFETHL